MRDQDDQMYIYELYGISTPRKIKAQKTLRGKIGPATKITPQQIHQAQNVIDNPEVDFSSEALDHIEIIEGGIQAMIETHYDREADYDRVIVPLSNIKGQAGMFGNRLASEMSNLVLRFLERYKRLDNDALEILRVYCQSLRVTYKLRFFDPASEAGQKILTELESAINRYNQKFESKIERR